MNARVCRVAVTLACASPALADPTVGTRISPRKDIMIYAPVPHVPLEARSKHLAGSGVFLFHVRPDGTVSSVEVIQSTGHKILDDASVEAFSRWRFKSGLASSKVKIPVTYTGNYPEHAK